MAQKVQVTLVCDLHDDEVEGSETITFALDGSSYEIDVCNDHAAELRDAFAAYSGAARRAGRAAPAPRRAARGPRAARAASPVQQPTVEIREWARAHGHAVNERGRLPQAVVKAYEAAH